MSAIPIYVPRSSPRLNYTLRWIFGEQLRLDYYLIQEEAEARNLPFVISYGKRMPRGICIPDSGLLYEKDIRPWQVATGSWQDIPTLFAMRSNEASILPFDLLSAVFYLLSRYEEYLPFEPDKHGRYPVSGSILQQQGWLERPLADQWIAALRHMLQQSGIPCLKPAFGYRCTYDIDIAWSYLHKGWERGLGGLAKALKEGRLAQARERLQTWLGARPDPYFAFDHMQQLHQRLGIQPVYFILAALRSTAFDKNIHPNQPAMRQLIKRLAAEGLVGQHPSYYADKTVMLAEQQALESITGKPVQHSRQHYIRMQLPATYRLLAESGIQEDYSMGYGTALGFRAGTGQSFWWYDLEREAAEPLRLHPFCFMDTTARFEAGLSAPQAFERLRAMQAQLQAAGSTLTTVMHNFSLGSSAEWTGWPEAYETFLEGMGAHALRPGPTCV